MSQHGKSGHAEDRRNNKELPGLEHERFFADEDIADQATAHGIHHTHENAGRNGQPCVSRIIDGSSHAAPAAAKPQIPARRCSGKLRRKCERVAPDDRRAHKRTRRKIATAQITSGL